MQDLSSPSEIEPAPPAVEAQSHWSHWTTREVPNLPRCVRQISFVILPWCLSYIDQYSFYSGFHSK